MAREKRPLLSRYWSLWTRRIPRNHWFYPATIVMVCAFILDQISKHWILYSIKLQDEPTRQVIVNKALTLSYVENRGVSFGIFSGGLISRVALTTLATCVAIGLFYWLAKLRRPFAAFGIGLIIAGALGNAYDRALYGFVVDFIDVSNWAYHPWLSFEDGIKFIMAPFIWVFNIADICVNVGVMCLIFDAIFGEKLANKNHVKTTT